MKLHEAMQLYEDYKIEATPNAWRFFDTNNKEIKESDMPPEYYKLWMRTKAKLRKKKMVSLLSAKADFTHYDVTIQRDGRVIVKDEKGNVLK